MSHFVDILIASIVIWGYILFIGLVLTSSLFCSFLFFRFEFFFRICFVYITFFRSLLTSYVLTKVVCFESFESYFYVFISRLFFVSTKKTVKPCWMRFFLRLHLFKINVTLCVASVNLSFVQCMCIVYILVFYCVLIYSHSKSSWYFSSM